MTDDLLPEVPVLTPGAARLLAKKAAEQASKDSEAMRIQARSDAVFDAMRRTAWAVAVALALLPAPAFAHSFFDSLKIPRSQTDRLPEGVSCCNDRDCAIALARHTPAGWEALTPAGGWEPVPETTIIHDKTHPSGSAVLCWGPVSGVICFTAPAAGG